MYDNYVWRLFTETPDPIHSVVLPKDLEWIDEFSWSPIFQEIKNSISGSIFINEYEQLDGRFITLEGKDDMCWIQRPLAEELLVLRNLSLKMNLQFVEGTYSGGIWSFGSIKESFNVMFRQNDTPIEFESVKRFDNFESDSWFKIRSIKLMEINTDVLNPCD